MSLLDLARALRDVRTAQQTDDHAQAETLTRAALRLHQTQICAQFRDLLAQFLGDPIWPLLQAEHAAQIIPPTDFGDAPHVRFQLRNHAWCLAFEGYMEPDAAFGCPIFSLYTELSQTRLLLWPDGLGVVHSAAGSRTALRQAVLDLVLVAYGEHPLPPLA